MVRSNTVEVQGAVVSLIQAINNCVEAHTHFAQSAHTLLGELRSSQGCQEKPSQKHKQERLTVRELAQVLPLSRGTIRDLAKAGTIPSARLGKKLVFDLQAVLAALDHPQPAS